MLLGNRFLTILLLSSIPYEDKCLTAFLLLDQEKSNTFANVNVHSGPVTY